MKVTTWNTWKKNNNPSIFTHQDSSLGTVTTIEPTLRKNGFRKISGNEPWENYSPKEQVKEILSDYEYQEAVYYVWNHSRGYCSYIEIFYK